MNFNQKSGVLLLGLVLSASGCVEPPQDTADAVVSQTPPEVHTWKLITTWPKDTPALGRIPERFAEVIETMSAGRLKVQVYGANELVPALEVFDSVSNGAAEMGHGASYYWRSKTPAAQFFTTVPFGMNAQEMNSWLRFGGGLELWQELYEPFNLLPMVSGNSGVQMFGWFNREINSLDDIRGLKMRIPGLGATVLERAGGLPVTLPGNEIYTSLQSGVIDATEWVGPYNDIAFSLQEVGKYYYYPGWHEPGAALETIINLDAWNELDADLQTMVEIACQALNADMLDEITARNNRALNTLIEEHGVELRELPDDVVDEFRRISKEVVSEAAEGDELSQRIVASYFDFLQEMRRYHSISERAYYRARDAELD